MTGSATMWRWASRALVVLVVAAAPMLLLARNAFAITPEELCPDSPLDCLPAWRWGPASATFTNEPGLNPLGALTQGAGASVTGLLFALARIIWSLTLILVRFSTSIDWLGTEDPNHASTVGGIIDGAFLQISQLFGGFVWVLLLAGVITVVVATTRRAGGGQGKATWKQMIRPVFCMGLLVVMVTAVDEDNPGGTWAPSWWIATSANAIGQVWDSSAGLVSEQLASPPQWDPDRNVNDNSCDRIAQALHDAGRSRAEDADDAVAVSQYNVAELVSSMWQSSHLLIWRNAQFDTTRSGARVYCWELERHARTPYDQQLSLINSASNSDPVQRPFLADPGSPALQRTQLTVLAVCMRQGTNFTVAPEWRWWRGGITDELVEECERAQLDSDTNLERRLTGSSQWAADTIETVTGVFGGLATRINRGLAGTVASITGDLVEGTGEAVAEQMRSGGLLGVNSTDEIEQFAYVSDTGDSDQMADAREVADFLSALGGGNLNSSMAAGILAVVVAVMYGLAIGGVAFGATVAQMGAVLFWVFFSVVLMLGMWPTDAARDRFYRAIRLGVGVMIARFVMLGLLTAIVLVIAVFQQIVAVFEAPFAAAGSIPVFAGSVSIPLLTELPLGQLAPVRWGRNNAEMFFQALPPLVALIAFKRLFREMQFGNPTSFGGAAKMVGSITTNGTDMSSYQPSRATSLMRQRLHPMSPYGPFSMRRQTNRLRRAVTGRQNTRNRDVPPEGAHRSDTEQHGRGTGGAGTAGGNGSGTQRRGRGTGGAGTAGGSGLPPPPPSGPAGTGTGGARPLPDSSSSDPPENDTVDAGTSTVRSGVVGILDRYANVRTRMRETGAAFSADHPHISHATKSALRRTARLAAPAKFVAPLAVAGGALASFPIVGGITGLTGAALTIGGYKAAKFAGRSFDDYAMSGRFGQSAAQALAADPQAEPLDAAPDNGDRPRSWGVPGSRVRTLATHSRSGPPPPPPVPTPPPVPPDAVAPSQMLPPQLQRQQFPDGAQFTQEGMTAQGRYVFTEGHWWRDTGVKGDRGSWFERAEMPHPAMETDPVRSPQPQRQAPQEPQTQPPAANSDEGMLEQLRQQREQQRNSEQRRRGS